MNTTDKRIVIAAFYKFVKLPDVEALKPPLLKRCLELGLKGTFLLAPEGINGAVAGSGEGVEGILRHLRARPRLADLEHRQSHAAECPFHRMKVKIRREIISLGIAGLDPARRGGRHIEPEDWNAEITRPDTLALDLRNHYESGLGGFRNAVAPQTGTFREFPGYAEKHLDPDKHARVAMFCTGGIRCEKASAYLLSRGFGEVLQLRGGILNYLERIDRKDSLWQGECFVFDRRVAIDHDLAEGDHEQCFACRRPITREDMLSEKYQPGISCPHCHDDLTPEQRRRFRERQRQVALARRRGEKHIGAS